MTQYKVLKNTDGMTLIEVMITLGIASIMMLGILDLVSLSNKAGRNTTINADWSGMIANLRLVLSDQTACQDALAHGGLKYVNNVANAAGLGFMPALLSTPMSFNKSGQIVLDAGPFAYSTFSLGPPPGFLTPFPGAAPVNGLQILQTEGPTNTALLDLSGLTTATFNYVVYTLSMNVAGSKKNKGDQAGNPAAHSLGGDLLKTNIPIVFKVVTGPVSPVGAPPVGFVAQPDVVAGCYGMISLAQACADLGGVLSDPVNGPNWGDTPCVIRPVQFMGGSSDPQAILDRGQAGQDVDMVGERIQLWGMGGPSKGKRAQNDYAIGMNVNSMWFNIGGDGSNYYDNSANRGGINQYLWYSRTDPGTGGNHANWFVNALDSSGDNALMALDAGGNLTLNPSNDFDTARLIFGINPANANAKPGEFVQSNRTLSNDGSPGGKPGGGNYFSQDVEFYTANKPRMLLRNDGAVLIGGGNEYPSNPIPAPGTLPGAQLIFGGLCYPTMDFNNCANGDYYNGTNIYSNRDRTDANNFGDLEFNVQKLNTLPIRALTLDHDGNATVGADLNILGQTQFFGNVVSDVIIAPVVAGGPAHQLVVEDTNLAPVIQLAPTILYTAPGVVASFNDQVTINGLGGNVPHNCKPFCWDGNNAANGSCDKTSANGIQYMGTWAASPGNCAVAQCPVNTVLMSAAGFCFGPMNGASPTSLKDFKVCADGSTGARVQYMVLNCCEL